MPIISIRDKQIIISHQTLTKTCDILLQRRDPGSETAHAWWNLKTNDKYRKY